MLFSFAIKRKIKAPIEIVFDALTNPIIASEYTGEAILEHFVGGEFAMFDGLVSGKILAFEKNRKLSYSWKTTEWALEDQHSIVYYIFKEKGANTIIELTHSQLPNQQEADSHKLGWEEQVFRPLERFLEVK